MAFVGHGLLCHRDARERTCMAHAHVSCPIPPLLDASVLWQRAPLIFILGGCHLFNGLGARAAICHLGGGAVDGC